MGEEVDTKGAELARRWAESAAHPDPPSNACVSRARVGQLHQLVVIYARRGGWLLLGDNGDVADGG